LALDGEVEDYTVTIQDDTIPPVINCPADVTVEVHVSTDPSITGFATATDNADPAPHVTYGDASTQNADGIPDTPDDYNFVITRTWTAEDASGNVSTCPQIITVQDTIPPVITTPPNVTLAEPADVSPANTGEATAVDNGDPTVDIRYSDVISGPGDGSGPAEIQRTWTATDASHNSASQVQLITILNVPPIAADNQYAVDEDHTLTVVAPGVLANDTDPADPLTAQLVGSGPSHAESFTLNDDGSFTYTPQENFNGTDTFIYTANDGTDDSNVATVTITVNPVNDAPVAADDDYEMYGNTLVVPAPGVLSNDTDPESSPLTAILEDDPSKGMPGRRSWFSAVRVPAVSPDSISDRRTTKSGLCKSSHSRRESG
jgi:VCBS repeat-containing protein